MVLAAPVVYLAVLPRCQTPAAAMVQCQAFLMLVLAAQVVFPVPSLPYPELMAVCCRAPTLVWQLKLARLLAEMSAAPRVLRLPAHPARLVVELAVDLVVRKGSTYRAPRPRQMAMPAVRSEQWQGSKPARQWKVMPLEQLVAVPPVRRSRVTALASHAKRAGKLPLAVLREPQPHKFQELPTSGKISALPRQRWTATLEA